MQTSEMNCTVIIIFIRVKTNKNKLHQLLMHHLLLSKLCPSKALTIKELKPHSAGLCKTQ